MSDDGLEKLLRAQGQEILRYLEGIPEVPFEEVLDKEKPYYIIGDEPPWPMPPRWILDQFEPKREDLIGPNPESDEYVEDLLRFLESN